MFNIIIRRATAEDKNEWQRMRLLLWPEEASKSTLSESR